MKRFKTNLKYIMFGAIALAMAACADENVTGGNDSNPDISESSLNKASYTMGGGDQSRAFNFGSVGKNTRSISDFQMPQMPSVPAEAVELSASNSNNATIKASGTYNSYWFNAPNQPTSIYVTGQLQIGFNGSGSGITVYVLPGGKLEIMNDNIATGISIYNWGTLTSTGNLSLNTNPIFSNTRLEFPGTLTFPTGAQFYCKEETVAKKLYVNSGAKVESCAFIIGDEDNYPTADTWGNIDWNAEGVIEFGGGNLEFHTSYIEAGFIKFNSNNNLHLSLEDNGRINTKYLQVDPKQNDQMIVTLGSKAVVCAKEIFLQQNFQQNEEKLLPNFGAGVAVQDVQYIHENGNNNSPSDYDIPTDGGINNPDFTMESSHCSPGYGDQPTTPEPSLDLITDVKSPTHDHDADKPGEVGSKPRRHLSATSLTFDGNGNIYASYHMRGGNWGGDTYDKNDIEGCIERWSFDGNEINIGNWMWTNEFDFNHIILDGSDIITVGHKGGEKTIEGNNGQSYTDYGGIIGKLPVSNFFNYYVDADEYKEENFQYKYLTTEVPLMGDYENESGNVTNQKVDYKSAGDGNCVVRVGEDEYFVATSAGYGKINASDFSRIKDENGNVQFVSTPGSAKYLVENNGEVNVFYLNDRAVNGSEQTTSFGATLAKMNTSAFPTAGTTLPMPNVSPVDGKNVIAVDGNDVYACLSNGGLAKNAQVFKTFGENRSVNGVAVDNDYIYVANGSYISVLDKSGNVVVERKGKTENVSANFVEVKQIDGVRYIFVAFGQEGIKVFRLNIPGE